uniref:Uncharacterized protein n=1 Tax=Anguilla anguilla TaxID=7936 RepID=A0A0E9T3P3_ANGAN
MNCLFQVLPQHLHWVLVRTLTRTLQNLVLLSQSDVDLLLCFWVIVLLHKPFTLQLTNILH